MTIQTQPFTSRPTTGAAASVTDALDWRQFSSCKDEDPEMFFPAGVGRRFDAQVEEAQQVCRPCPVREQCLEWALNARQDTGVWGGLSEQERRRIHKRRPSIAHHEARSAVEVILQDRLDDFHAAHGEGLGVGHVARTLGTNTTTVYAVLAVLAERVEVSGQLDAASEAVAA